MITDERVISPLEDPYRFVWVVDSAGYEVQHERPTRPSTGTIDAQHSRGPWLVRKGGELRRYLPLTEQPDLFLRFMGLGDTNLVSLANITEFAAEFGFLNVWPAPYPKPDSESIPYWLRRLSELRSFVQMSSRDDKEQAALYFSAYLRPRAWMSLRYDAGRLRQQIYPSDLVSAMGIQAADATLEGVRLKQCRTCPAWFRYGPGTGHRARKVFCSDRCRVAWNRKNNKEGAVSKTVIAT